MAKNGEGELGLVLSRKPGEQIVIDGRIVITFIETQGGKARIAVKAPADVRVDRMEVHDARKVG